MNKTVNINLGGMFFHIDEDAYQKLTRYFDAIKRSISNSSGHDEIIKDIEMRVSELLNDKQKTDKYVIGLKDVDAVIAVMGQPEDYIIEDDLKGSQSFSDHSNRRTKKLYRDKEKGMIGGVAAGLGHYFGVDAVWIRIVLILLVFAGFGTGILAYIILWIVTPEAVTTTEKLEMTGEPVTISNIEKKVREEFENVSDKIKNVDYDKYGNQIKTGVGKIGSSFSDFIMTIFKIFAKFLGVILIITGITILFFLLIGIFTLGSGIFIDFPWQGFIEAGNFTDYPIWAFGLLMFFAVGIPFFFLALLGFKLLAPNMKSIGNIAKYTLFALWLIAVALAISIGIKQASAFAVDGRVVKKETLNLNPNDTLLIKFKHNDYFAKNVEDRNDFMVTQDSTGTDIIYSNEVSFKIEKTEEKLPYIQIEKEARGKSLSEAKRRAEQIKYGYKIIGNQLILDNYLLTDLKNKYRDQEIEITVFVPEGTLLKPDASVQNYDRSDDEFFNLHYSSDNYIYKVENSQIKCLNCPADENEYNDVYSTARDDSTDVTVTINNNGVTVEKDTLKSNKTNKGLKINKDGIIIKTN
ncbi:PspC domain-containing protein [Flavobacterium sp. ZB4P23]|uniref:PspC domain-containing protein n=1 Tax=Flavobacterium bomense TaxID=2497483 RepID=A0A3S0MXB5_9FLAO|nr:MULTISPECIES: PspC domain-containing protein [Flavobacterium]RTY83783.1 PspC domain-containing protein [Flavobacterium sp. ZB4P23]RTY91146.1 PspC domain-containing protein [Flavobacterium sp. RSP46]RTZ01949.1 PspC domain-containing protein [Flavobacterium bomense]RTZ04069.1 PspC domain-containing protein [Flavobacterium sp. GSP6]